MDGRECKRCGEVFVPSKRGRPPAYCSRACRQRAYEFRRAFREMTQKLEEAERAEAALEAESAGQEIVSDEKSASVGIVSDEKGGVPEIVSDETPSPAPKVPRSRGKHRRQHRQQPLGGPSLWRF